MTLHKDLTGADLHRAVRFTQSSDPGASASPGDLWLDPATGALKQRSDDGTSWINITGTSPYPGDEAIQDMIASFLQAGANINLSYNDAANTLTIAVTGLTSYPGDEAIQDMLASFLVAGTGISLTYNDAANTLTIEATSGGGMTNPMTTAGDIIVGGTGGAPQRLGAGSNGQILAVSSGAPAWQSIPVGLTVILDGGGQTIQTTQPKPLVRVPFAGTVTAWYVNADQSGSIVVDVQRAAAGTPTSFSSIAGTEKPSLSSQQSNSDTSLTTWTTALNAGDWLRFVVESASTVQLVAVALHLTRTV
jgi:hypothetical protein